MNYVIRRTIAAMLLGLPAALLAHSAVFGETHPWGGTDHFVLLQATLLAGSIVAFGLFASALLAARRSLKGSVMARGPRGLLPAGLTLFSTASIWFLFIETLEIPHHQAILASVLAIAAATLTLRILAFAFARATIDLVVVIVTALFPAFGMTPPMSVQGLYAAPHCERCPDRRLLFTRPPPPFFA